MSVAVLGVDIQGMLRGTVCCHEEFEGDEMVVGAAIWIGGELIVGGSRGGLLGILDAP